MRQALPLHSSVKAWTSPFVSTWLSRGKSKLNCWGRELAASRPMGSRMSLEIGMVTVPKEKRECNSHTGFILSRYWLSNIEIQTGKRTHSRRQQLKISLRSVLRGLWKTEFWTRLGGDWENSPESCHLSAAESGWFQKCLSSHASHRCRDLHTGPEERAPMAKCIASGRIQLFTAGLALTALQQWQCRPPHAWTEGSIYITTWDLTGRETPRMSLRQRKMFSCSPTSVSTVEVLIKSFL